MCTWVLRDSSKALTCTGTLHEECTGACKRDLEHRSPKCITTVTCRCCRTWKTHLQNTGPGKHICTIHHNLFWMPLIEYMDSCTSEPATPTTTCTDISQNQVSKQGTTMSRPGFHKSSATGPARYCQGLLPCMPFQKRRHLRGTCQARSPRGAHQAPHLCTSPSTQVAAGAGHHHPASYTRSLRALLQDSTSGPTCWGSRSRSTTTTPGACDVEGACRTASWP